MGKEDMREVPPALVLLHRAPSLGNLAPRISSGPVGKGLEFDFPFPLRVLGFCSSVVCVFLLTSISLHPILAAPTEPGGAAVLRHEARQEPASQGGTPKTRYGCVPLTKV